MAVYLVTGNLGGGKSLMSVFRIESYLKQGRPVATNLDIRLWHMLPRSNKNARLVRLPDKPCLDDFLVLGTGNSSYDEEKNGLIVLDECGTWFNSRQWGDKSRQAMIDWLLHSRKQGWDVIFIVQNVTLIDKQARLALGEHVVYCRRTDRLNIPVVGSLFKLLWGGKLPLPRVHLGVVKYGLLPTSLSVDTWVLTGNRLFQAYDTKQSFSADYPHGPHTMLPPYYTHCRAQFKRTLGNYMRLTKIYLKRFSRLGSFASGGIVMFILFIFFTDKDIPSTATAHTDLIQQTVSEKVQSIENSVDPDGLVDPVAQGDQLDEPVVFTGPIAFSLDYFIVGNVVTILFDGLRYSLNDFPYPLVAKGEKLLAMLPGDLASYHSDLRLERAASARLRSNDAEAARSDL